MQYAMEADPGRLTASFPTFDTQEEAERAASFLNAKTPHLQPIRILCRNSGPGGAWSPTAQVKLCWCDPTPCSVSPCPTREKWLDVEDSELGGADA